MKHLNKEYYINLSNNLQIKFGSANRLNPNVIYVIGKGWICPLNDNNFKQNIEEIINQFKTDVKQILLNSEDFINRHICICDINIDSMEIKHQNYFSFEIYIKQRHHPIELEKLHSIIIKTFHYPVRQLVHKLKQYDFIITSSK